MTEWRRVGESNLEVSDDGRVRRDGVEFVPGIDSGGYRRVNIYDRKVSLHRMIASAFIPNTLGKQFVDHIDGNRLNNAVSNLRWATRIENNRNKSKYARSSSLPRGVRASGKRFVPQIAYEGKLHYLGTYDSPEEASEVYEATAQELFGEFYRSSKD